MHGFHGTSFIRTTAALAFGFASRLSRGFALRLPRGALHVCSSNYRQHIPVGARHVNSPIPVEKRLRSPCKIYEGQS
jgi:hypothetical protein